MKIALMLLVAVIMLMMSQEADSRRVKIKYYPNGQIKKIKYGWWGKRDADIDDYIEEREALWPPIVTRRWWGKRQVGNAEFDAAYNAAAKDGVFTDKEIKEVFDFDEKSLAEFKETFDMDGDGVVTVKEYEMVKTVGDNGTEHSIFKMDSKGVSFVQTRTGAVIQYACLDFDY